MAVTFRINKADCFNENDNSISIIQGNTALINASLVDEETKEDIFLGENDVILWYVRTISGKEVTKRVFTSTDMNMDGSLTLKLRPLDTLDIFPSNASYIYGLTYAPNNGEDAYTFATGKFIVKKSCGTVEDIAT